ncbi:hypothetical protein EO157G_3690 [Escherichia phage SP27]|uniref:Phage protein n=1 Tax=Escherichia phage SP27 TaxID=2495557 RepID=A0A5A4U6A7_9CAUD|nr:hypothetical protein EO157G_3690 [Escherichia phage SP27]
MDKDDILIRLIKSLIKFSNNDVDTYKVGDIEFKSFGMYGEDKTYYASMKFQDFHEMLISLSYEDVDPRWSSSISLSRMVIRSKHRYISSKNTPNLINIVLNENTNPISKLDIVPLTDEVLFQLSTICDEDVISCMKIYETVGSDIHMNYYLTIDGTYLRDEALAYIDSVLPK